MIEWFQVNFQREQKWLMYDEKARIMGFRLVASPLGNTDARLRVATDWKPYTEGEYWHNEDMWLPLERDLFKVLRLKLELLERGAGFTTEQLLSRACVSAQEYTTVCQKLQEVQEERDGLHEEIEAMRVADPSELAAQLIQSKKDMEELKTVVAKHLVEALKGLGTMHLSRLSVGRALALVGLDVAKEAGL